MVRRKKIRDGFRDFMKCRYEENGYDSVETRNETGLF